MYCIEVSLYAPTASFRIPEYHTFQQTLSLPPITTLRGILGAAAGYNCEEIQEYVKDNEIKIGVTGTNQGRYRDLWKYAKIKSGETISAVLTRECLFDVDLSLYYACESRVVVDRIRDWFLNPYYAITAGNSDDLAKIMYVGDVIEASLEELDRFENTILPGDHSGNYTSDIDIRNAPILKDIFVPQVYLLPYEFRFDGQERRISERRQYTFVDTPVRLNNPILGIKINGKSVALL
jgi:CRISPR-associated protein Cas5t